MMANEVRLIDATEARKHSTHDIITHFLDRCPTVDAVEVVRCKDCKHRGYEGECPMYHVEEIEWDDDGYTEVDYVPHDYTVDEGFCDRGERREGE